MDFSFDCLLTIRVFGTFSDDSDWDFTIVMENGVLSTDDEVLQLEAPLIDANVCSRFVHCYSFNLCTEGNLKN